MMIFGMMKAMGAARLAAERFSLLAISLMKPLPRTCSIWPADSG